jgi:hypothetical protein
MIELAEVLKQMDKKDRKGNAIPFKVEFITADLQRNTGGEVRSLTNAVMVTPSFWRKKKKVMVHTTLTPKKGQNHYENMTRNIRQLNDTATVKIHIWLITKFNNENVVWHIMG